MSNQPGCCMHVLAAAAGPEGAGTGHAEQWVAGQFAAGQLAAGHG